MRILTPAAVDFIKSFEGLRLSPYPDSSGRWTIGYGHTMGVSAKTPSLTQADADQLLLQDLQRAKNIVDECILVPLSDNQYGALVSLAYNAGSGPFEKTLGNKLNAGDYAGAADEFDKWAYIDGRISAGLMRRRAQEKSLFMGGN